jgi:hypothetical protein
MRSRNLAALAGLILGLSLLATPTSAVVDRHGQAPYNVATDLVDRSGIALVGPDAIQFRAQTEAQAVAFDAALNLAFNNRDHMGYPWIDLDTKTLELSAVDQSGQKAASEAGVSLSASGFTTRVTTSQASIAKLDAVADEVTRLLAAGVPHAELIWMTEPDQKNNRVVITISKANDELMSALASRFGTDLIAVRVREGGPASAMNRDNDQPAFWGGAKITTSTGKMCTTGFAWNVNGQSAMLTAAHCISTGGTVSYTDWPNAGSVASGSGENWSATNGTQYYTGQSVYRGDVALIRYSSQASGPSIYSGAAHTSTSKVVKVMASRWSQVGDAACVNGITTGGWCGIVTLTGINAWYAIDGIAVWARHVVQAEAIGNTCPTHGDSGGPVYRDYSGGVAAVGVYTGGYPYGLGCVVWFTDIWDAYYGLPGTVKVTG